MTGGGAGSGTCAGTPRASKTAKSACRSPSCEPSRRARGSRSRPRCRARSPTRPAAGRCRPPQHRGHAPGHPVRTAPPSRSTARSSSARIGTASTPQAATSGCPSRRCAGSPPWSHRVPLSPQRGVACPCRRRRQAREVRPPLVRYVTSGPARLRAMLGGAMPDSSEPSGEQQQHANPVGELTAPCALTHRVS